MMQTLMSWLPLLNFAIVFVFVPVYKLIRSMQKEIETLTAINKDLHDEVTALKELVFKIVPSDVLQAHLLIQIKEKK